MIALYSSAEIEHSLNKCLNEKDTQGLSFLCGELSRADVFSMAGKLAAAFLKQAETSFRKVPVCLAAEERSVIAAALLAALVTDTVLVLPHGFSKRALQQMQDVTGFSSAVVDVDRELPLKTELIFCDEAASDVLFPEVHISADQELLQIFTGGSTGAPKIWSKTVGNIFGEAMYIASRYHIDSSDIVVSTVSPYHIYGLLFSIMIPLVTSASVLAETPSFPLEIVESVQQQSATILVSVPVHYRILTGKTVGTTLRLAFSSAGMLEKEDSLAFSSCNSIGVVEVYGSTETGGLASRNRLTGQDFFSPLEPLDWQIREGRFYVKSPFLSPDLMVDEEGFFLSGDRVEQVGADSFSLHGRADAITKVGGIRVDLDEIRDVLQKQPQIEECVVVPIPARSGRGNLIAVLIRGEEIDIEHLKKVMMDLLEPAAQPKRIRVVAAIPTNSNGKYDRKEICKLLSSS